MALVVSVLRSGGGEYTVAHVERLRDQVHRHAPPGTAFACVSDDKEVIGICNFAIKLSEGWPGWWAKIAALRIPGPVLYLDLDVTLIRDMTPLIEIAQTRHFVMIR